MKMLFPIDFPLVGNELQMLKLHMWKHISAYFHNRWSWKNFEIKYFQLLLACVKAPSQWVHKLHWTSIETFVFCKTINLETWTVKQSLLRLRFHLVEITFHGHSNWLKLIAEVDAHKRITNPAIAFIPRRPADRKTCVHVIKAIINAAILISFRTFFRSL